MNSPENQVKRLTVDQIEVPEGMFQAARLGVYPGVSEGLTHNLLAAALLWLAENPIVPSEEESHEMREFWISFALNSNGGYPNDYPEVLTAEWQRRMFLRKQDALPDEVKKLLAKGELEYLRITRENFNADIVRAWKLGGGGK